MADAIVMPWGKYRGRPLTACDAAYLRWLLHQAKAADPELRAAVRAELDRRQASALAPSPVAGAPAPPAAPAPAPSNVPLALSPGGVDKEAAVAVLGELADEDIRVTALGDGAVRYDAEPLPDLRARFLRLAADIDALARWVRYDSRGLPRVTAASTILAGLRRQGFDFQARSEYRVVVWPHTPEHRPLHEMCASVRAEFWFRVVVNLPDPDGNDLPCLPLDPREPRPSPPRLAAAPAGASSPPPAPTLADLKAHVAEQIAAHQAKFSTATGRRRQAIGRAACRWLTWEMTLERLAADAADVDLAALRRLRDHCRAQGRRQCRQAARWRAWEQLLEAEMLLREIRRRQAGARAVCV